jgi:hypothetical protein
LQYQLVVILGRTNAGGEHREQRDNRDAVQHGQ